MNFGQFCNLNKLFCFINAIFSFCKYNIWVLITIVVYYDNISIVTLNFTKNNLIVIDNTTSSSHTLYLKSYRLEKFVQLSLKKNA